MTEQEKPMAKLNVVLASDLPIRKTRKRRRFSGKFVKYKSHNRTIEIVPPDADYTWEYPYWVDLDRCRTQAECWDWIAHIGLKTWATQELMGELATCMVLLCEYRGYNK